MNNCIRITSLGRAGLVALILMFSAPFLNEAHAMPQHGDGTDGDGMEQFDEVDPYTKGEKELMDKLGYARFAPFGWCNGYTTTDLEEMLGGAPMIWVETEHFKIGSSLSTYKMVADKPEKERIKGELARLKERLGKLKVKRRNRLDPWLRLHLYAQRAEEAYATFFKDFDLKPEDFDKKKPYLGHPNKFLVLVCERKSELSRYTKTVHDQVQEAVFRTGMYNDTMMVGASYESITEDFQGGDARPFDQILHCRILSVLAACFIDGYEGNIFQAPRWVGNVLGHYFVRRVDPRWMLSTGHGPNAAAREDEWKWEPDILKLVKNKFFASTKTMFGWVEYEDMNKRDHMIAWSKMEYLLTQVKGDKKCWLSAVCKKSGGGGGEKKKEEYIARQTRALLACFELTPKELDDAWLKWVKKAYKRRK